MSAATWVARDCKPKPGDEVFIDGKRGVVMLVGKGISGTNTMVSIRYEHGYENATLQEFLATLEVQRS